MHPFNNISREIQNKTVENIERATTENIILSTRNIFNITTDPNERINSNVNLSSESYIGDNLTNGRNDTKSLKGVISVSKGFIDSNVNISSTNNTDRNFISPTALSRY